MARAEPAAGTWRQGLLRRVRRVPRVIWQLLTQTVGTCLRYRVTGLAAEGAFFAILSLPPLIFGLAGSIGYLARQFDVETIDEMKDQIIELAGRGLTADSVTAVIEPTLNDVLNGGGRLEVVSIGFVIALWSGSRALNVFVDTITIMYGMGGRRGIIKTRALSFTLYCVALLIGVVVLPLVLAGPSAVNRVLPPELDGLNQLYWPIVIVLSTGFLNTLYHLSVPVRTPWISDLPGAFLALSVWILGSFVLRWTLQTTVGGTSIYGPLAAPIAVLLWLYLTAIAVLIGAALNAVMDRMWPHRPRSTLIEPAAQAEQISRIDADGEQLSTPEAEEPPKQEPAELPAEQQEKQQEKQPDPTGPAAPQAEVSEDGSRRRKSRARPKSGNVA
ncbi:MAG: YihY/virulence factor BrkB family protein [Kribbellaceae bacterium]|nr:YihY/virulence factor BrkB family protein [Kribbellaceae bacterium]